MCNEENCSKRIDYDPEVFVTQFPIVKRFVYHLLYSRLLRKAYLKQGLKSEFWTDTIDAHLLQAAIYWAMVFGAEGVNATHWTRISKSEKDSLGASFRGGLSEQLNISWRDWKMYRKKMTEFRNRFVAHRELEYDKPVPEFDLALQTAYYYDGWIRQVIRPDVFDEPALSKTAARLEAKITPLIQVLMRQTAAGGKCKS